jgi:hypothetical protein
MIWAPANVSAAMASTAVIEPSLNNRLLSTTSIALLTAHREPSRAINYKVRTLNQIVSRSRLIITFFLNSFSLPLTPPSSGVRVVSVIYSDPKNSVWPPSEKTG